MPELVALVALAIASDTHVVIEPLVVLEVVCFLPETCERLVEQRCSCEQA